MKFICRRIFPRWQTAPDYSQINAELAPWVNSVFGEYSLEAEQRAVDEHLAATAGYRNMLLKVMQSDFNTASASQLHKFTLAPFSGEGVAVQTEVDALPLPSEALDVVVLHHILDFSEFPHEALKESARVVQAAGHLLIVGYNPWSFFGFWRLLCRGVSRGAIWRCRCLSVPRVTDWLRFVGFQPEKISYGAFRPPIQTAGFLNRFGFLDRLMLRCKLPLGGFYVITARKIRLKPVNGKKQWLSPAINPVTLASRARVDKRKCTRR